MSQVEILGRVHKTPHTTMSEYCVKCKILSNLNNHAYPGALATVDGSPKGLAFHGSKALHPLRRIATQGTLQ